VFAGRVVPAAGLGSGCRTLLGFSRVRVFSNVARILPSLKILSGSESASPRKHLRTMKLSLTSPQRRRGGMRIQKKAVPLKIIRVRQVNSLSSENFRPLPSGSLYAANSEHGVQRDAVLFQMNKQVIINKAVGQLQPRDEPVLRQVCADHQARHHQSAHNQRKSRKQA
jgi:hypothetical protein